MSLFFKENSTPFTLGVEVEVQLLDAKSLELTPRSMELLSQVQHPRIIKEMFQSTVELVTDVCKNAHDVEADVESLIQKIEAWGKENEVVFASTGTHPLADYNDRRIVPSERYQELLDRNQMLIRRMAVYGLHVHVAMRNGDECIQFTNFFLTQLPLLIALSASSCYWNKVDTGLAAIRPTMYESHPTSGMPFLAKDWKEFEDMYGLLLKTKSIESMKDIWWDIRPSPGYGTMEIRICDVPATMKELKAITALIHVMALHFDRSKGAVGGDAPVRWILRENKWRAIRFGLDAEVIEHGTHEVVSLKTQLQNWLSETDDLCDALGYRNEFVTLENMMTKGVSSDRQRAVFSATGSLQDVVALNVKEFSQRYF